MKKIASQSLKNIYHLLVAYFFHFYYGQPAKALKIIAVTGTNGKTTTSTLIYHILKYNGFKVGLISTISAKIGDDNHATGLHVTSPSPWLLHKLLRKMVDNKLNYLVLEVTSHALDQNRVAGIKFDSAVFTNITHEHQDYHHTFQNYLRTKASLIKKVRSKGKIFLNLDEPNYPTLKKVADRSRKKVFSYGLTNNADWQASNIKLALQGTTFTLQDLHKNKRIITINLPGEFNVQNTLGAIAVTQSLGISSKNIKKALHHMNNISGRWEILQKNPYRVVVDFAHTPDALEKILIFARTQLNNQAKIILVFGCAGKRDITKRPLMGEIAGKFANLIILTAEDPRQESIDNINKHIEKGIIKYHKKLNKDYYKINDRQSAIAFALKNAMPNDIVILAGKGHEKSINLDGLTETPWSDIKVTKMLLSKQ